MHVKLASCSPCLPIETFSFPFYGIYLSISKLAITICSRTTNLENKSNLLKSSCALLRFWSPSTFDHWLERVFFSCASPIFVSWIYWKGFFAPFKNSSKLCFITVLCLTVMFPIWKFPQRYSPSHLHLWNGSQLTSQIAQFSSSLNFRMIKILFPFRNLWNIDFYSFVIKYKLTKAK